MGSHFNPVLKQFSIQRKMREDEKSLYTLDAVCIDGQHNEMPKKPACGYTLYTNILYSLCYILKYYNQYAGNEGGTVSKKHLVNKVI